MQYFPVILYYFIPTLCKTTGDGVTSIVYIKIWSSKNIPGNQAFPTITQSFEREVWDDGNQETVKFQSGWKFCLIGTVTSSSRQIPSVNGTGRCLRLDHREAGPEARVWGVCLIEHLLSQEEVFTSGQGRRKNTSLYLHPNTKHLVLEHQWPELSGQDG